MGRPFKQVANETDAVTLVGYKWVLTGVDTDSGLGFAYLTVDANAQSTKEELEQKIIITVWMAHHDLFQSRTVQLIMSNKWAERCPLQSTSSIEN